ncbi:hypothetical protein DIC66_06855 [Rhodoferax lacus]|uniref:Uncharacterized protein n=1 Tax=Rhodoferax lacus TaxID=2184758 RepID=A0A3E1RDY0_9BURK|nr:hypothetical protein DIC66_06855 [Rhodoferax lacus]
MNWVALGAGLVSFGTVALVLLGYGVSLAVESTFAIPHAAVFESTFELMDLASIAMLEMIPALTQALADGSLILRVYRSFAPLLGVIVGLLVLLGGIGWFCEPPRKPDPQATPARSTKPASRLHWGLTARHYLMRYALLGLWVLLSPLLSLLGILATVLLAAVLAIVPVIGMSAGKAHIEKWVLGPAQCRPVQTLDALRRSTRLAADSSASAPRYADCVALTKDAARIAAGRVIFYTSKAVVLVDDTGRAKRVPTGDVVVEVIDAL